MAVSAAAGPAGPSRFRHTLVQVIAVQAAALLALWLLQARYHQ
jgi:hypothetical protein